MTGAASAWALALQTVLATLHGVLSLALVGLEDDIVVPACRCTCSRCVVGEILGSLIGLVGSVHSENIRVERQTVTTFHGLCTHAL